jgi:hypothetical protein
VTEPARTFANLFSGRTDAYGLGRGGVVRDELTVHHYASHLRGEDSGIGIFPLRDDGTVSFAAIDLDEPDFELARLLQEMLPGTTWLERSRSGNAHVWAFFTEPVPGWVPRGIMRRALEAVGRPDVEVFPKQDRLRAGMVGNYINLPLHGDSRPLLTTFEGRPTGPGELIEWRTEASDPALLLPNIYEERNDPADWTRRAETQGILPPEHRTTSSEFGEQPVLHVCAEYIIEGAKNGERPIMPGHRHQVLFHLACQLYNYVGFDQEEASQLVREVNAESPEPLNASELDRILRNAWAGQYTFTGCDDPVMAPYIHPDCKIARAS